MSDRTIGEDGKRKSGTFLAPFRHNLANMSYEQHTAAHIKSVFPGLSLYEIFEVSTNASEEDIKKAYRRKALEHHPDRGGDAEKFKAISCGHTILSDPEKRKLYDRTGELDDSDWSDDAVEWCQYFRNLFPKVTVDAIEKFRSNYKFSEEERRDILAAYTQRKGDIEDIMETVILAEEEDRERIIETIKAAIESEELPALPKWTSYMQESEGKSSKKKAKKSISLVGKASKKKAESEESLILQMMANRKKQASAFSSIIDKYSKPGL